MLTRILNPINPLYAAEPNDPGGGDPNPPPPPTPKTFTQEELNKILADDRRKHQARIEKLVGEVDNLKKTSTMSSTDREELEKRLEAIQAEALTKEELAKRERDKLQKDADKRLKELTDDRDAWQKRYVNSRIEGELLSAAAAADAYNPKQFVVLLRPQTELIKNDAGDFVVRVKLDVPDDKGGTTRLDLNPADAVKQMAELSEFANLFKTTGTGGLNLTNSQVKPQEAVKIARDTEAYRKARKDGTLKFD